MPIGGPRALGTLTSFPRFVVSPGVTCPLFAGRQSRAPATRWLFSETEARGPFPGRDPETGQKSGSGRPMFRGHVKTAFSAPDTAFQAGSGRVATKWAGARGIVAPIGGLRARTFRTLWFASPRLFSEGGVSSTSQARIRAFRSTLRHTQRW